MEITIQKTKNPKTRTFISFKSKNQSPFLMMIREFIEDGQVVWAEVLFSI